MKSCLTVTRRRTLPTWQVERRVRLRLAVVRDIASVYG